MWPDSLRGFRHDRRSPPPTGCSSSAPMPRSTAPRPRHALGSALAGSDDGELYLEYRESEQISLDDGRIRSAGFDTSLGFGLRAVAGEATGYAHAGELSEAGAARAPRPAWRRWRPAIPASPPSRRAPPTRGSIPTPIRSARSDFPARTALLAEIDAYARGKDPRVVAGDGLARRRMAGGADHARRRHAGGRPAAAGAAERLGGGRAGRPARDRQLRHRRPLRLRPRHRAGGLARRGRRGAAPGAGQPRQPSRPRPARWRWCSARAGPASCCTRRSATGWRATSTARRPRPSPACSASGSPSPGVTVVDDGTHARPARQPDRRRRGHADQPHRADRGRRPGRLHAGPAERAADGHARRPATAGASPMPTRRCRG